MNPTHLTNSSFPSSDLPAVTLPRRFDFGSAGMLVTPDEFDAVTDFDKSYRYELINGVLVVNPIPSEGEAGPNELLGNLLWYYQQFNPQGESLNATLQERYLRGATSRRRGDRVIWAGLGRTPDPKNDIPTIVVEFVSESRRDWRRDYLEKRREYREVGIKEYWIVDRFQRRMTVYQYAVNGEVEIVVAENEVYRTELLPGFELPIAKLFAEADRWNKPNDSHS